MLASLGADVNRPKKVGRRCTLIQVVIAAHATARFVVLGASCFCGAGSRTQPQLNLPPPPLAEWCHTGFHCSV